MHDDIKYLKLTKKQRSKVFDMLYALAQEYLDYYQPCKFSEGKCVSGFINGCCSGPNPSKKNPKQRGICEHLNEDTGCSIQSLGCKTYLCGRPNTPVDVERWHYLRGVLAGIREVGIHMGIRGGCYTTKEMAIKRDATKYKRRF